MHDRTTLGFAADAAETCALTMADPNATERIFAACDVRVEEDDPPCAQALVLACAYFATVWIGRHLKRQVLAEHLAYLNRRLNEVPQFGAYAITSGLKRAFSAFGRLARSSAFGGTTKTGGRRIA